MTWLWNLWWNRFTLVPKLISAAVLLCLVLLPLLLLRGCGSKPPKLDEDLIQRGEAAKKAGNDKELANTLIESDRREAEALAPSVNAKAEVSNVVNASSQKWNNTEREELQAEFDRRKNP